MTWCLLHKISENVSTDFECSTQDAESIALTGKKLHSTAGNFAFIAEEKCHNCGLPLEIKIHILNIYL